MLRFNWMARPLFRRELRLQERTASRWLSRERWFTLIPALVFFTPVLCSFQYGISSDYYLTIMAAEFAVWIFHALTVLRMVLAGSGVIAREHVWQNWDSLVLTGVSARHIVLSKWWAALHQVRGWMLGLGLLRLAIIPTCLVVFVVRSGIQYPRRPSLPPPELVGLAVLMTAILTILDTLCCTAVGVVASAVAPRSMNRATALGIVLRFAPVVLFTSLLTVETYQRYRVVWLPWRWWAIFADGGTGTLIRLVMPTWMGRTEEPLARELLGLGLVTVMLVGATALALILACRLVQRRGALAHETP